MFYPVRVLSSWVFLDCRLGLIKMRSGLMMVIENMQRVISLTLLLFGLVFLFLAYSIPYHVPPWRTFHGELLAGLAVTCFFVFTLFKKEFYWHGLKVFFGIFLLLGAHLFFFQDSLPAQREQFFLWCLYLVISYAAYLAGRNSSGTQVTSFFLNGIVIAGVLSACLGLAQWIGIAQWYAVDPAWMLEAQPGERILANIGQPNNLGTLLVMALVALVGLQEKFKSTGYTLVFAVLILLMVAAIALTGSRAAWLSLLMVAAFSSINSYLQKNPVRWTYFIALLLLGMIVVIAPVFFGYLHPEVLQESRSLTSDSNRVSLWAMSIQGILEKPWIGWGFGGQAVLHQTLSHEYDGFYAIAYQLHNVVIDLFVVFGLLFGTIFLAVLGGIGRAVILNTLNNERVLYLLLCIPIVVHSFFEFPHYYGFFLWPLFFFVGLALAEQEKPGDDVLVPKLLPFAVLVIALFVGVKITDNYLVVEDAFGKYGKKRYSEVNLVALDSASNIFPGLRLRLDAVRIGDGPVTTEEEKLVINQCATHYPFLECLVMKASIEADAGNIEEGQRWFVKACRMFGDDACRQDIERFNGGSVPAWAVVPENGQRQ